MVTLLDKTELGDIKTQENIQFLVKTFYGHAREDELLGPIFDEAITDWDDHLPTMYSFWERLLFKTGDYQGNPFDKHVKLPVGKEHFAVWIKIFLKTVDDNFYGPKANEAKRLARSIAATFQLRMGIEGYDTEYAIPDYKHPSEKKNE